jgi:hypothetical protein
LVNNNTDPNTSPGKTFFALRWKIYLLTFSLAKKTKTKPETSSLIKTPDDPKKGGKGKERVAILVALIKQILYKKSGFPVWSLTYLPEAIQKIKTRHTYREAYYPRGWQEKTAIIPSR